MRKLFFSTISTILLSLFLLCSATYAVFVSEDSSNIVISSAKVKLDASISNFTAYSNNWDGRVEGAKIDDNIYSFYNGGTAEIRDNIIILDRICPLDGVDFTINIKNHSNVAVKYQTVISCIGDKKLAEILDISIDNLPYSGENIATPWKTLEDSYSIPFSLYFPLNEEAYGLGIAISFAVLAVQENAFTSYDLAVSNEAELRYALLANADSIRILNDFEVLGDLHIPANTIINGDNHTLRCSLIIQGSNIEINNLTIELKSKPIIAYDADFRLLNVKISGERIGMVLSNSNLVDDKVTFNGFDVNLLLTSTSSTSLDGRKIEEDIDFILLEVDDVFNRFDNIEARLDDVSLLDEFDISLLDELYQELQEIHYSLLEDIIEQRKAKINEKIEEILALHNNQLFTISFETSVSGMQIDSIRRPIGTFSLPRPYFNDYIFLNWTYNDQIVEQIEVEGDMTITGNFIAKDDVSCTLIDLFSVNYTPGDDLSNFKILAKVNINGTTKTISKHFYELSAEELLNKSTSIEISGFSLENVGIVGYEVITPSSDFVSAKILVLAPGTYDLANQEKTDKAIIGVGNVILNTSSFEFTTSLTLYNLTINLKDKTSFILSNSIYAKNCSFNGGYGVKVGQGKVVFDNISIAPKNGKTSIEMQPCAHVILKDTLLTSGANKTDNVIFIPGSVFPDDNLNRGEVVLEFKGATNLTIGRIYEGYPKYKKVKTIYLGLEEAGFALENLGSAQYYYKVT